MKIEHASLHTINTFFYLVIYYYIPFCTEEFNHSLPMNRQVSYSFITTLFVLTVSLWSPGSKSTQKCSQLTTYLFSHVLTTTLVEVPDPSGKYLYR